MDYQLGSERLKLLQADSIPGRLGPRRMLSIPDGLCHAVRRGDSVAACGRGGLTLWAKPWPQDEYAMCSQCLELAPAPGAAAKPPA